jgi:hypothetical protein
MGARLMRITKVYRYSRGSSIADEFIGDYPNYHHLTASADGVRVGLERGINIARQVDAVDGGRRPVIALRSSPWKAGSKSTPWHDSIDLDHGHVRYFGDHKISSSGPVGSTVGNSGLRDAWRLHQETTSDQRLPAPPVMIFRSVTEQGAVKGYVEFCGVAVIERLETIVQRDPKSGMSFANYVFDLAVLDASNESEQVDWRWIDDRRNPAFPLKETLRYAPKTWQRWVTEGAPAIPRIRRNVSASRVLSKAEQQPQIGTTEEKVLNDVYHYFEGQKHSFESVAAKVAAEVFRSGGAQYQEGWLTRASRDGGTDFVGRLDAGIGRARTSLVVLGQAKCVSLDSSVSAEQIARVVARLRRGWIGVYVTTGVYSAPAQTEMIDDQYPIMLIDGRVLAEIVWRLAMESHGGDVKSFLAHTVSAYEDAVTVRRPEEILSSAPTQ